jgi:hypothetical protein
MQRDPVVTPETETCTTCSGDREIETCCTCENEVGNCTCEGDSCPETEMRSCPECDGTGEMESEEQSTNTRRYAVQRQMERARARGDWAEWRRLARTSEVKR